MQLIGHLGHLSYCTNIHAGETWTEILDQLKKNLPAVKKKVSPGAPFGVGLRLSAQAAYTLVEKQMLDQFRQWLHDEGLYVFTINGFSYGEFHGVPVKERVYRPDWSQRPRLEYSLTLVKILSELLPDSVDGSISTVPVAFMTDVIDSGVIEAARSHLVEFIAYVQKLAIEKKQSISLALEPEPGCYLSTTDDVITFFNEYLFVEKSIEQLAYLIDRPSDYCEDYFRKHVGICLDTCHAAVMFEDPLEVVHRLNSAGINIIKLQLTAALKITHINESSLEMLEDFSDVIYLHQTSVKSHNELRFFLDLPAACQSFLANELAEDSEWRIHYHVPLFLENCPDFQTTNDVLIRLLSSHRQLPICNHLEIETYTFNVFPEKIRINSVIENISNEIQWVLRHLLS